jgi:hypothetical protein
MELVEGEDLSQRIARGAIALDEALPIAKQIADALEAAHEQNIIHRDLKPANIKIRPDGTVKVLDFGLAKALAVEGSGAAADAMNSPTITRHGYGTAGTQLGMIIGTAAYMAPEQAKGRAVDRRADIWAFGVVLYEMLTGPARIRGRRCLGDPRVGAENRPRLERGSGRRVAVGAPAAAPMSREGSTEAVERDRRCAARARRDRADGSCGARASGPGAPLDRRPALARRRRYRRHRRGRGAAVALVSPEARCRRDASVGRRA